MAEERIVVPFAAPLSWLAMKLHLFGGHRQPKDESKRRSASDRKAAVEVALEREKLRFLRVLRRTDPQRWQRYMAKLAGIGDDDDQLAVAESVINRLKDMGILTDPQNLGRSELSEMLKPLLPVLITYLLSQNRQAAPAQPSAPQAVQPAAAVPNVQPLQQIPQQPLSPNGHQHDHAPISPDGPAETSAEGGLPMAQSASGGLSPLSAYLIDQFESKSEGEIVAWILANQTIPMVQQFTALLVQTPDAQLPTVISQIGRQNPDLRGFADWLFDHWSLFRSVTSMLRQQLVHEG